ncbi:MAG: mechanosensitive ion channel family protein [Acidobacteriaceae bacterium]
MSLLLAPPNSTQSAHQFFQSLWQGLLDRLQDFLRNDLLHLIGILVVAWFLFLVINFLTLRMRRIAERHSGIGLARAAQLSTLSSVLRATGIGIVAFFTVLTILRDIFDFNLGPLLASAGVAGVAIGLAAQTVVKDMINGMLILVEDQYNVGDVVTLAGFTGFVESMSLRKTTLRGFDGTLYLIPNSQITNVANQSRDFSQTTLNISVDFSADPDKVIELLSRISKEVRNEPAYKDIFLQDPQVLGVDSIKGSEVIYPIVVKTKARTQYDALREMQKRIRLALEQNHMLPGNPYRVLGGGNILEHPKEPAAPPHDPTTNKPNDVNPFTGEGM